jgi:lipopolysaccharide transport system permease protein
MHVPSDNVITAGSLPVLRYFLPSKILGTLWRHRGLARQMIWRNVMTRYRGSALGISWSFLVPLMMLSVYTFVFGEVLKARWASPSQSSNSMLDYALIIYSGLLVYNVFAETIAASPLLIVGNTNFVKKVVFPLEILPICLLGAALVQFLSGVLILLLCSLFFTGHISSTVYLFPLILVPLLMLSAGLSWFLSSLGVYLRDVGQFITVALQMLMFLSPVFYEVKQVPQGFRSFMMLNPLTAIVQDARNTLLWGKMPDWRALGIVTLAAAVIMQMGFAWFMKTRRGFADVL